MDHEDYHHRSSNHHQLQQQQLQQQRRTASTTAHPPAPSSAVSSSASASPAGNNTSWDAHYRRRGRTRERFDYTSEELSPEGNTAPPDKYNNSSGPSSQQQQQQQQRAAAAADTRVCLPNMFYPGDANAGDGMMQQHANVTRWSNSNGGMGQQYDDEGVRYYSSERYNLPVAAVAAAPASDSGAPYLVIDDDDDQCMAYAASRQRAMGHMASGANGRRSGQHDRETASDFLPDATYREQRFEAAAYGMPDAYRRHSSDHRRQHEHIHHRAASSSSLYHTREMQYNDYVKENLIMYGEGLQDAPSASTGLSQEELLQRKRREETWQKRREKRQQTKKNRVVNLPSSLFSTQASRQQQQQRQEHQYLSPSMQSEHRYQDVGRRETIQQPNRNKITGRNNVAAQVPYDDGGLAGITYVTSKGGVTSARGSTTIVQKSESSQKDSMAGKSTSGSTARGVRGLMVRRQRTDANSSGRRWKILPSLPTKFKPEESPSPNRARKEDPPAASATSRTTYPRDPPSVHSGKAVSVSTTGEGNPSIDEFDRFMENPNLMAGNSSTSEAHNDLQNQGKLNTYAVAKGMGKNSTPRPSYATFAPKSEYVSGDFFSPDTKSTTAKKKSPTSVMDIPDNGPIGVRWSENLFEQQFVSPGSARLDPFATDDIRYSSRSKPKSILKKAPSKGSVSSSKYSQGFPPFDDGRECPSDESPSKSHNKRPDYVSRMMSDPPSDEDLGKSSSPLGFIDGNGRSVSPILAESPTAEHDVVKTMAEWAGSHRNNSFDIAAQYHESAVSNNYESRNRDGQEPLSNSYVDFIEAVAAVVIQTKVRQLLARIQVESLREQCHAHHDEIEGTYAHQRRSPAITQKARNATRAKQSARKDAALDFYMLAAIRIQAFFRGWWVRDCLAVDNYCATMIQKTYRGWSAGDTAITRLYCIVRLQSVVRGHLARKSLGSYSMESDVYDIAATMIQAQWRSFSCEMKYLRAYEDILVVQSVARGWITRRLIWSWLKTHHQNRSRRITKNLIRNPPSSNGGKTYEQEPTFLSTPPRKSLDSKGGLSPSYLPHISYMRNTLTPNVDQDDVLLILPDRARTNFVVRQEQGKVPPRQVKEDETPGLRAHSRPTQHWGTGNKEESNDVKTNQPRRHQAKTTTSDSVTDVEQEDHQNDEQKAMSEIERRRKNKELEAKARQAEEKRRQEAQASELAELEFRRKKMAMKAEARKKEDAAISSAHSGQRDVESAHSDISHYHEEKKESDSYINNSIETNPSDEPDEAPMEFSGRKAPAVEPPAKDTTTTTIGPWQLKKRTHLPSTATKKENAPKIPDESVTGQNSLQKEDSIASRPSFARGVGVVAARKQQLFTSNGNLSFSREDAEVTSVDVAEMNSIVGKTPVEKARNSPMASTMEEQQPVIAGAKTPEKADRRDVIEKPKDVDVSALTEPTTASPIATTAASTTAIPKRVSGTTTSYVAQMQSQRSGAEQKRLDEMHAIFSKAGLMWRTKWGA